MSTEDKPAAADPVEALGALSTCLWHLACGWSLHPTELAACLAILETGLPGVDAADLVAAQKILAASRRLSGLRRDQASQLSIRFGELAEAQRARAPTG